MKTITRREFVMCIAAAAAMVQGCAAHTQQESGPAEKQPGDELDVSTKKGEVKVVVDGFDISQKLTADFQGYTQIDADHACGVLMLAVENVSYEDKSLGLDGYVDLEKVLRVKDADGVSLAPMSTGDVYGDYEASAGGIIECDQGEKVRVAVCYSVDPSLEDITVETTDGGAVVHLQAAQA